MTGKPSEKAPIRYCVADEIRQLKADLAAANAQVEALRQELSIVKEELQQYKLDNGIFGAGA